MNIKTILATALLIGTAVVFAFYILSRADSRLSRRLPILLELSVPLFLLGSALLPTAFPSFFASILHHSVASEYVYPIRPDGTRVTETWILARWWIPISKILYVGVFVGIVWAGWNIFRAEDRKLNVLAVGLGALWAGLGSFARLVVLPF
jgi:hypothetical protein